MTAAQSKTASSSVTSKETESSVEAKRRDTALADPVHGRRVKDLHETQRTAKDTRKCVLARGQQVQHQCDQVCISIMNILHVNSLWFGIVGKSGNPRSAREYENSEATNISVQSVITLFLQERIAWAKVTYLYKVIVLRHLKIFFFLISRKFPSQDAPLVVEAQTQ